MPSFEIRRPRVLRDPFSTELVVQASDSWRRKAGAKVFLYPVHPSGEFIETVSLASALCVATMAAHPIHCAGRVALPAAQLT